MPDTRPCDHEWEIRRTKAVSGGWSYRRQCISCLRVGPTYRSPSMDCERVPALRARRRRHGSRRRAYLEYLRSAEWRALRLQVLREHGHTCQRCGDPATDVHHLTYRRLGHESIADLEAACGACHRALRT